MMIHYERRLPHWDVVEQPLFVTFRLHGSLPANRVFPPEELTAGKAFVAMDQLLDRATSGPFFLGRRRQSLGWWLERCAMAITVFNDTIYTHSL